MKLLLVVGIAKDVFVYNMAKWLKKEIPDISIDVFEFYPSNEQSYDCKYYDSTQHPAIHWSSKIKGLRSILLPFHEAKELNHFLEGKRYDIIHCHWLTSSVVLTNKLKVHCTKLFLTFWGGEFETQRICFSKKLYFKQLEKMIMKADGVVNSINFEEKVCRYFPIVKDKYFYCNLGSSSMDFIYDLSININKDAVKSKWGLPADKNSVLIGYSGKTIHQHLKIIQYFSQNRNLAGNIHLLAPMTRGCHERYVDEVYKALENSGFSYSLIRDRYLSDEEIAELRYGTDIVLQLSDFDGFSRSIVECLSAKSILIYGSWLNYDQDLKTYGFKANKVDTFEEAFVLLSRICDNFEIYLADCKDNDVVGREFAWAYCIKNWVKLYNSIWQIN